MLLIRQVFSRVKPRGSIKLAYMAKGLGYCLIENDLQLRNGQTSGEKKEMEERALKNLPLGATGYISRCLTPSRADVYRLLEMGLCRGAHFTILRKATVFGAIELALQGSRLCIADELASEFMAITEMRARNS